jgi:hypothetical protein
MTQLEPQLLHFDLGQAPASGNDAVTQCNHFKGVMRSLIGRDPDGAYLHMEHAGRRLAMQVIYDPETHGAEDWAKQARDRAEQVWETVRSGKSQGRVVARSRGA